MSKGRLATGRCRAARRGWPALGAAVLAVVAVAGAQAQGGAPSPSPSPGAPAATPAPAPAPASEGEPTRLAPVEVSGSRADDVQERRQSTAAKIVIGREEIDRYGDTHLADVLKRLPGITVGGRGGGIRMRGLGAGYTQILLDGERVPPGFSLESLTPDQVERIEILRAPTAETGARAIAGTVNIVTRGGYTRRVNDVRLGLTHADDLRAGLATWSRNATVGPFVLNGTVSAYARRSDDRTTEDTEAVRVDDGTAVLRRHEDERSRVRNRSLHASGRVEWRLPGQAGQLLLVPLLIAAESDRRGTRTLEQPLGDDAPYTRAEHASDSDYAMARLNATWTRRLDDGRVEVKAHAQGNRSGFDATRDESLVGGGARRLDSTSRLRDRTLGASAKWNRLLRESHTLVSGVELERNRRDESRTTTLDGQPVVTGFGDDVAAEATRVAVYTQDEWDLSAHWSAHVGVRWEQIRTVGSAPLGLDAPVNRSSVWTPLAHLLWKPDPKGRDQVRLSLTRSYKSPTLNQLIARPRLNTSRPPPGPNAPTDADYAGNADLKPELATGVDLAIERYLPGSGVLSVNVFHRRIRDYLRSQTELEVVPWSDVPRYVTRPRNVGRAMTQGVEVEAKFRASEVWAGAPRVDLRANASAFRSRVAAAPGPDNRLDEQPPYTANLGADYRFAAVPLTLGGSANWSPGYTTRLSETQSATQGARWTFDAYALWTFNPALALRLSLADLAARDAVYGSTVEGPDAAGTPVRETSRTATTNRTMATLRLEMKL